MAKIWWVVVAAGRSTRMGGPVSKVWMDICGRELLARTLDAAIRSGIGDGGVVVVQASDVTRTEGLLTRYGWDSTWIAAVGGTTRAQSVRNGLLALVDREAGGNDVVLVHDGARPLLGPDLVERVVTGALRDGAAVPLVPVTDTVKVVDLAKSRVQSTLPRDQLGLAQTPQGFHLAALLDAHLALPMDAAVTDDAEVMERAGIAVTYVAGSDVNRKITTALDREWLEWRMERLERGGSNENWPGY